MKFVPVIHPAATFRQPSALGPLIAHVENFLDRVVNGIPPDPVLHVQPKLATLQKFYAKVLRTKAPVAVDVECGRYGLLPGWAELRAVGLGVAWGSGEGLSWKFPFTDFRVGRLVAKMLADPLVTKVFMNGEFYDRPVLERHKLHVRGPVHDIREMRHSLSSTSKVSLGAQAALYLCCGPWKAEATEDEDDEKGFVDAARIPAEKLLRYNAEDCVRTAQIRMHHRRDLERIGEDRHRVERIYAQQRRLAVVGADMHLKGFPFDLSMSRHLHRQLRGIFEKEKAGLQKLIHSRAPHFRISDDGGVNDTDLKALIYRECSKPGIKSFNLEVPLSDNCWTESGQPAVNKDALLYLFSLENTPPELKEIFRACWKVDAPLKALSTYITSEHVRRGIGPDKRMHPRVNTCGPETYRWSCSKPNLFNLPEAQELESGSLRGDLPNMRALYVAPKGHVIVHRDFKQLELEVMAEYTGDLALRQMLDTGDAHTERVYLWFGIPRGQPVPKLLRRQGKVVGFASQYGGGIETVYLIVLEQVQNAAFDEILELWTRFREVHVSIVQHWENSVNFAKEFGYSEAPIMGYRRYISPGEPIKPTETSNYAIQGGAAAIANSTMVGFGDEASAKSALYYRLKKEYPDAWLAMHVYDSFDVICPEKQAEGVGQLMEECMSGPWLIGTRLKKYGSDLKIGTRWSEV